MSEPVAPTRSRPVPTILVIVVAFAIQVVALALATGFALLIDPADDHEHWDLLFLLPASIGVTEVALVATTAVAAGRARRRGDLRRRSIYITAMYCFLFVPVLGCVAYLFPALAAQLNR